LATWVYDEIGCAGAILDEFCVRNLSGDTVAWVFGVSLFSRTGEHIGWCEEGVFYDIDNCVLGFLPDAKGPVPDMPGLASEPAMPRFSKRPCVPTLRGRSVRGRGQGWSSRCLSSYLAFATVPTLGAPFIPRLTLPAGSSGHAA
jgi:hypothetical protein